MDADVVGDALSWLGDVSLVDQLDAALTDTVEEVLQRRREASKALDELDARSRRRVLRAPEVTRQLLFGECVPGQLKRHITRAVAVEAFLAGAQSPPATPSWSALGDVHVRSDGTCTGWPQLDGESAVPLDFGSPWARRVDLSGRFEHARQHRPGFTAADVVRVHQRVVATFAQLPRVSPTLSTFVARATTVLVLQIDPDAPDHVASGSNGRYIGRSFITNPHTVDATTECLAEGIVHEAIHALIYRECLARPWVTGEAAREVPRVRSPWTGRALPVRPYLEAAFVWFGIAHLWAIAMRRRVFEGDVARHRLARSVSGFCRGSLVDPIRPWLGQVRPDVVESVRSLQERIVSAMEGAE